MLQPTDCRAHPWVKTPRPRNTPNYEHLLAEHEDVCNPRFAYDRGVLQIKVTSFEHEQLNRLIANIFAEIADELGVDYINAGSTTFNRRDLEQGFEADTSFYIQNAERVRGKKRIDLMEDPPPDLVIEIAITQTEMNPRPSDRLLRR